MFSGPGLKMKVAKNNQRRSGTRIPGNKKWRRLPRMGSHLAMKIACQVSCCTVATKATAGGDQCLAALHHYGVQSTSKLHHRQIIYLLVYEAGRVRASDHISRDTYKPDR